MKDIFHGHYHPTHEDFWENCIFVFDTNVLLDLFRLSERSTTRLLEIMEAQKERIWLPYQVAEEYHRNLNATICGQAKRCQEIIDLQNRLLELLRTKKYQSFLGDIPQEVSPHLEELGDKLKGKKIEIQELLHCNKTKERIAEIFHGKIGKQANLEDKEKWCKDAEERYKKKIPPGFSDTKKDAPECYGDYLVWRELIEYAKESRKPILFVSGDTKEDWVCKANGQYIGPHPDLCYEFKDETSGQSYYSYTLDGFLKEYSQIIEKTTNTPEDHEAIIQEILEREEEPMFKSPSSHSSLGEISPDNESNMFKSPSSHSTLGEIPPDNESKTTITDSDSIMG